MTKSFFLVLSLVVISIFAFAVEAVAKNAPMDENAEVIQNMKDGGFDFSKPHLVDYYALFTSKKAADAVANEYRKEKKSGKDYKIISIDKDENGEYELLIQVLMDVTYENVTSFEKNMVARAQAKKGKFNGWGVYQ